MPFVDDAPQQRLRHRRRHQYQQEDADVGEGGGGDALREIPPAELQAHATALREDDHDPRLTWLWDERIFPAANVLSADPEQTWSARRAAPALFSVRIVSALPRCIARVELLPDMLQPTAGEVEHVVRLRGADGGLRATRTFRGRAADRCWLRVAFTPSVDLVRAVEVETTACPSWVAWRQLRLFERCRAATTRR